MIEAHAPTDPTARPFVLPPLEPGDHLSLAGFERRSDAMPALRKAELIEGVVHMGSPVRWEQHGQPHVLVSFCLTSYATQTPFDAAHRAFVAQLLG